MPRESKQGLTTGIRTRKEASQSSLPRALLAQQASFYRTSRARRPPLSYGLESTLGDQEQG